MTGMRTAAVQVVATAGLAALVAGGGLGRIVKLGFGQQDYGLIIAGAILIAALALLTELLLVRAHVGASPRARGGSVPPARAARRRRTRAGGGRHAALSTRRRITNRQRPAHRLHCAQGTGVA